ncbi:hypothetical protein K438DRAFT_863585 [Mycena galopus ATCC 62051]|nr:hypothetical protein K438DRAFT_863585 [Mycena galopus ATCC 62051]
MWIRPSGRVSVEIKSREFDRLRVTGHPWRAEYGSILRLFEPHQTTSIIASMSLDEYHGICALYLSRYSFIADFTDAMVTLGSIHYCPSASDYQNLIDAASLPDCKFRDSGWSGFPNMPLNTENGWARIPSSVVANTDISRLIYHWDGRCCWLAQANHIFTRLRITSNYEDFWIVGRIKYCLRISGNANDIPAGFLFMCPLLDLQANSSTQFRRPECPAYWSLDPSGTHRLSAVDAGELGFPPITLTMQVQRWSWNESVYAGIRRLHEGKGFDPDSQDVARTLGYRLLQVTAELDTPFSLREPLQGTTSSCR